MLPADAQAEEERAAFLRFVHLVGQAGDWASVESRVPPEPDLVCVSTSRGAIAFELVAITDPLIAQVNAGHGKSPTGTYTTSDPTEKIIRKKLSRSYSTNLPMELLIYSDLLVITPEDEIVRVATGWLDSKEHSFRRAWFMGERSAKEIWFA